MERWRPSCNDSRIEKVLYRSLPTSGVKGGIRSSTQTALHKDVSDGNVHELLGVKSPWECIELSTAQMRKQFEIVSAQNEEFCTLAQEMATKAAGTIKTGRVLGTP
jgi:hypothetical protein